MTDEPVADVGSGHGGPDDGWPGPRRLQIFGWVTAAAIVAVCIYIAVI